jgi:hypothetical protein
MKLDRARTCLLFMREAEAIRWTRRQSGGTSPRILSGHRRSQPSTSFAKLSPRRKSRNHPKSLRTADHQGDRFADERLGNAWSGLTSSGSRSCFPPLGIIFRRYALSASALLGLMFLLWVVIVHAPRVAAAPHNANEWTSAFVALAMAGSAWSVAGSLDSNH